MIPENDPSIKKVDSKSVIPDSSLIPPPPDLQPLWDAFLADPADATARIALGQMLNDRPEFVRPIVDDDCIPGWWFERIYSLALVGSSVTFRVLRPELQSGGDPLSGVTRRGVTPLFNRIAYVADFPDPRRAATAAQRLALLGLPWVLTNKPRPRISWVGPARP